MSGKVAVVSRSRATSEHGLRRLRLAVRVCLSRRLGSGRRVLNRSWPLRRRRLGRSLRKQRIGIGCRRRRGSPRHPIARGGRRFRHLRTVGHILLRRCRARSDRRKIDRDRGRRLAKGDCSGSPSNDRQHHDGVGQQSERRGSEPAQRVRAARAGANGRGERHGVAEGAGEGFCVSSSPTSATLR